ncbi:MAG: flagellar motor switch protein FliG [candidate division Zixibacteria bacterium]|nr:flagellar motor switch protein FliG [candidate division Zixibacteria bacterium]
MALKYEDLNPAQRAAVILVALGQETSAKILKHLDDNDIEAITVNVANLRDIPPEVEQQVLKEVYQLIRAREYISQGGLDYARKILEDSVGKNRAVDILNKLENNLKATGFEMLKNIDPRQLINFIQNEHPQTIALILTQLQSQHASAVLAELPPELQADVSLRIATMEKISPEVISEIEGVLEAHFEASGTKALSISGGTKTIADILNLVETSSEKMILEAIENIDPELAGEIKNLMFVFEDVILLDDRSIQRVIKEVETKDLSMALKAASEELKAKIFSNVSERVAVMVQEEMEFMGPMRLSDVESAQQKIVETIRRLQEEGQIVVASRGKDDLVV